MSEKLGETRSFRQWLKNQERLKKADELGLNVSDIINRAIDHAWADVMKRTLENRRQETEKALSALV